ncbi:Abi family protein [Xanthomonas campestris pv. raphani]|uniref:Abi family protein n=1 Tax=Xanthomonas TaxID=338 RepID=UPI000996240F|nr:MULTISPECIES: Abi family protein [Xanthomonas]KAB0535473.1 CAAX protease [Xanthomonas cissicola]MEA9973085.1 Abi family protein [Xanthomonas campestris pv. raphani]
MTGVAVYSPQVIEELISTSRLHSYRSVFTHLSEEEVIGAYLWNAHACAQLYPLIQIIEVSLRNAIDASLTPSRNQMWWAGGRLRYASYRSRATEPDVVQKLRDNFVKATRQVAVDKWSRYRIRIPATHAEIVAKAEFSTWEWVLDSEFYGNTLFWPAHLPSAFRGEWAGRSEIDLLTHVRDQVRSIRMFRNRVFHHEPAWKKFGISSEEEAVAHLQERVIQLSDFLKLLHGDLHIMARGKHMIEAARRACSSEELSRFKESSRQYRFLMRRRILRMTSSQIKA